MDNGRSLHIVGAGIIGVACALRLQLHGYRVTLTLL
jgi:glycine/D-amino acid oxidase-like deaminating enzyme